MVRIIDASDVVTGIKKYIEFAGTSSDTKPEESYISTGSMFLEADTGDIYLYDEDGAAGSKWAKVGG